MRVLLDESIPRGLKSELVGHEVSTVTEQGWRSKDNGELLAVASPVFDVLITADQRLQFQQNLARFDLGIIVLAAYKNRPSIAEEDYVAMRNGRQGIETAAMVPSCRESVCRRNAEWRRGRQGIETSWHAGGSC